MEHLSKPYKALANFKYISKYNGKITIIVPIITNHFKHYLILMFIAFPYGIYEVLKLMKRITRHYKEDGLPHVTVIKPENITPYFRKSKVISHFYRHKWFYGYFGRIVRRFTNGKEPIKDIQGYYEIIVWK